MSTEEFNYELPEKFIAQTPIKNREESKLLVLDKDSGKIEHKKFHNIIDFLNKDDVLVINNTKVIPARLIGTKKETNATIEILLLKDLGNNIWECLAKPVKRLKIGTVISFGNDILKAEVIKILNEGIIHIKLIYKGILMAILNQLGSMPLPPYIHKKLSDNDRYQTVYAKKIGSAAAPTAGLHFTKELFQKITDKGVKIAEVTLHVGLGTFRPVQVDDVRKHHMHSEEYYLDEKNAVILNNAKENNHKIIAVGTTTTRVLETIMTKYNKFTSISGNTDIFIYPGYKFKAIDSLITNFHLPKSTLLMLVSAFSNKFDIIKSYEEAKKNKYRFFSFGDAMLIK